MVNLQTPAQQAVGTTMTVWMVGNKTSMVLFASEEIAHKYVSGFAASVGGGMHISPVTVFGATPVPAVSVNTSDDPENEISLSELNALKF